MFTIALVSGEARVFAQDPPPIDILVEEGVGVSDGNESTVPEQVDIDESVNVDDEVSVVGPVTIGIAEDVAVNEVVTVVGPVVIEVAEDVTVIDDAAAIGPATVLVDETITITDNGGPLNAAPLVEAGADQTVNEGEVVSLAASVIVLDPQLTTATVDWGDGSAADQVIPTSTGAISASHLYVSEGTYTVVLTVAGLFGDQGIDTAQIEIINLPPEADVGGPYEGDIDVAIVLTAIGNDPGEDPITYAWDLDGDGVFDNGNSQSVIFSSPIPGTFPIAVLLADDSGASTEATGEVEVLEPPDTGDQNDGESDENDRAGDVGKVSGRAVIGELVSLSKTMIVVAAKVGPDFTNVQIHNDPASTQMAAAIDAESYTTGSRVVVIADRDVLSGNAIALKIAPIPGTAVRKHDRVLVSKPKDGDAANLVDAEDGASNSVVKDEAGDLGDGDQIVVLVRRNDSNERNEKPKVIDNNDVKNRLDEYARQKFDDGDTDSTGQIDKLAEDLKKKEQERIDEAKKHADEAVRRAAELADEKAKREAEKDAADPVKAVRKQAVADSEDEILECAARILGRAVTGENDLDEDEKAKVIDACLENEDDEARIPETRDGDRGNIPPEVLSCIVQVMGSVPNRPLTADEEARVIAACSFDDGDDEKSTEEKNDERNSNEAVDARKLAFCEANPTDSHCLGGSGGSSGEKDGETGEDEKIAFCAANPTDARCAADGDDKDSSGTKGGETGEDEKIAFCAANPGDPRCAAGGDDKDSSGTKDGETGKDEPDSKGGSSDDDKGDSDSGSKDDSGSKPPGK